MKNKLLILLAIILLIVACQSKKNTQKINTYYSSPVELPEIDEELEEFDEFESVADTGFKDEQSDQVP
tara:strand:+ start:7 stop:210 length:204 start_codon:yes stop_codon:yes gene_type:complete